MFCVIYRSTSRDQTYLYVEKERRFFPRARRINEELWPTSAGDAAARSTVVRNWLTPIWKKLKRP